MKIESTWIGRTYREAQQSNRSEPAANTEALEKEKPIAEEAVAAEPIEESKDALVLSQEYREAYIAEPGEKPGLAGASPMDAPKSSANIQDESGALTRRLVSAETTMEIHDITRLAMKELGSLRMIAAGGDEESALLAQKVIKKLEKLVRRAGKKLRSLNHENALRMQERRAKKAQQETLEKEIKSELERTVRARKQREKKYLQDDHEVSLSGQERAQIEARAEMMARAQLSAAAMSASSGGEATASASQDNGGGQTSVAEAFSGGEVASEGDSAEVPV